MAVHDPLEPLLTLVLDPVWYRARYPDVAAAGVDPLRHFIDTGLNEHRDPNRWFDSAWYLRQNPDAAAAGAHPLVHYLTEGAARGRDPHPRFDSRFYIAEHPEASGMPMLFHLRTGARNGWLTERPVTIGDYLPSVPGPTSTSRPVDIVIPVFRGLEQTKTCLNSVLADPDRPDGHIIVIEDRSPEPALTAWLLRLAKTAAITLIRNKTNLGFVASANTGMAAAGRNDVVLLNSDTEVATGWLRRLQAHATSGVASVSPLSNNASICGWLTYEGAPIPDHLSLACLDAAARDANVGRWVGVPTTVGFCMYLRRDALDAVGNFDTDTFGKGYGEENDFCLRASAMGWTHRLACDVFVRHIGGVSFGAETNPRIESAFALLIERYPAYPALIQHFVWDDAAAPFRFALTMALFRQSGLPVMLLVSHDLDGGVRRHVRDVVARDLGRVNYLLLEPAERGVALSVPAYPGHPKMVLAAERWNDVASVLRSAGVTRAHLHHMMGMDLDIQALLHALDIPFDVTVHDYFAICPQVTMLPHPAALFCGEPGPAGCDACIAHRPSHGATDILTWRLRWSWMFHLADHVFAPSTDGLNRLRRYGLDQRAVLAPHEHAPPFPPPKPVKPRKKLRVAVLGTLAAHKGADIVASVALTADKARLNLIVLGCTEPGFPDLAAARMTITGAYEEGALPDLLKRHRPDILWFPAAWPETWSYTLTAAIASGLPIVATAIGAFPERLVGRKLTWLQPPALDPAIWIALFERAARETPKVTAPPLIATQSPSGSPLGPRPMSGGYIDLRRDGSVAVVVIPETFDQGGFTPCAYIRLLRPLDHPVTGDGLTVTVADAATATRYRADLIVTQRHAVATPCAAKTLAAHANRTGARLIYDLDDNLLTPPPNHPEAAALRAQAAVVGAMIGLADMVTVSTPALATLVDPLAKRILLIPTALDERIWRPMARRETVPDAARPVRILCMGTATHDEDLRLILPALTEIHLRFGDIFSLDLIGVVAAMELPLWIRRIAPPAHAARSYPGFVQFLTGATPWDIGLAPLADTAFNACKSAIKVLDYAALGLAILASDVPAYRGSLADGPGGLLVPDSTGAWYEALSRLIRDHALRRTLAEGAVRTWVQTGTLAARANPGALVFSREPRRDRASSDQLNTPGRIKLLAQTNRA